MCSWDYPGCPFRAFKVANCDLIAAKAQEASQSSARLGDADWLDAAFSAGDLMMVSVLLRLRSSGIVHEFPNLAAYVARGEARPAYQRAFAAQLAIDAGKAPVD